MKLLSAQKISAIMGIHPQTVCKLANEGKIPGLKLGSAWRFDLEMTKRWMRKKEIKELLRKKTIKKSPPLRVDDLGRAYAGSQLQIPYRLSFFAPF